MSVANKAGYFKMVPKSKAPHLSRAYRRHPERLQRMMDRAFLSAIGHGNWLLSGLLIRAGVTPQVNAEGAQV